MGPPETEKLLLSKGHGQQDETAAYRMGKDLHLTPHQTEDWSPKYTMNSRNWSSKKNK